MAERAQKNLERLQQLSASSILGRISHVTAFIGFVYFEVTGHQDIAGTAYGANYIGSWVSLPVSTCWNATGGGEPSRGAKVLCAGRGWMESPGVIADIASCGCSFVPLGLSPSPVSCWVSRCPVTAAWSDQVTSYLDTKGGVKQWSGDGTPLPWGSVLGALNSSE